MKAYLSLSLLAGLALSAHGQSSDSLTSPLPQPTEAPEPATEAPAAPSEPAEKPSEPSAADVNAELINVPSRYAGIDTDAYIDAIASTFSMRARDRDPFGRHQDPNYKPPVIEQPTRSIPKYKPAPVTPFVDIVEAIQITTIIPGQRRFLVGDRSFRVGDQIKLSTGNGKLLTVHVVAVRPDRVRFRHGVTNETADQVLKMLPGGMEEGGGGIRPKGLISPDEQAPLDISGSGAGTSLSSSR